MKIGPLVLIGALLAPLGCQPADTPTVESPDSGVPESTTPNQPTTDGGAPTTSGNDEGPESPHTSSSGTDRSTQAQGSDSGETRYLRQAGNEDDARVETAIAHFERDDGVKVDLFAEVHIAEPSHYAEVQQRLQDYEAVLYELVANPGDLPTAGAASVEDRSILSAIQGRIGSVMGLGFQLSELDYHQDNFVHADFTPRQFAEAMEAGGETPWTLVLKAMSGSSSRSDLEDANFQIEPIDFVAAARSGQLGLAWRKQLTQILLQMNVVQDMLSGTVLLDGRNRKAVEVLKEQIELGKKTFAIHYGGAHMPGIEQILTEELRFRRTGTDWVRAWGLTADAMPAENR